MNINEIFQRKVYGVPLPVLVVVLAGVAWFVYSRFSGGTQDPSAGDSAADTTEGDATGETSQPVFLAVSPQSASSTTEDSAASSTDTNVAWIRRATDFLVSKGFDATAAGAALSAYVAGESLTYDQNVMITAVVKQYGSPPEGTEGTSAVGKYTGPAVRQGTPPCTHTVKGTSDNSFSELARLYYGRTDVDTVQQIASANKSLSPSGDITTGTKVNIPKHRDPKYFVAKTGYRTLAAIARKTKVSQATILALNPGIKSWPVKAGTKVQYA